MGLTPNILYDDDSTATGLLDFSEAHHTTNLDFDFFNIPNDFFTHFQIGYEAESGTTITPELIQMMQVSRCPYIFHEIDEEDQHLHAETNTRYSAELKSALEKVETILSY